MHILDKIVEYKQKEVAQRKQDKPIELLKQSPAFSLPKLSISESIRHRPTAIIAEFKRKSPSKQNINLNADPIAVAQGYEAAGVAGISVLTDTHFFGGSFEDLQCVKEHAKLPILQKDFIVDPYQIYEAKAVGADFILLIAAVLTKQQIHAYAALAQSLGMEVLVEIHAENELEKALSTHVNLMGINNRNLKTFEVNLEHSMRLAEKIPSEYIKVSESGISSTAAIHQLKTAGFQAFLMGENFMKTASPGEACFTFINNLKLPV